MQRHYDGPAMNWNTSIKIIKAEWIWWVHEDQPRYNRWYIIHRIWNVFSSAHQCDVIGFLWSIQSASPILLSTMMAVRRIIPLPSPLQTIIWLVPWTRRQQTIDHLLCREPDYYLPAAFAPYILPTQTSFHIDGTMIMATISGKRLYFLFSEPRLDRNSQRTNRQCLEISSSYCIVVYVWIQEHSMKMVSLMSQQSYRECKTGFSNLILYPL